MDLRYPESATRFADEVRAFVRKELPQEIRDKVFRNMSTRAAETLREDLDSRGPVRVSEVENEQKELLKIVRRLADEGQIQLASGSDDDFL
jgi:flagellar motor switch protein FliG